MTPDRVGPGLADASRSTVERWLGAGVRLEFSLRSLNLHGESETGDLSSCPIAKAQRPEGPRERGGGWGARRRRAGGNGLYGVLDRRSRYLVRRGSGGDLRSGTGPCPMRIVVVGSMITGVSSSLPRFGGWVDE